MSASLSGGDDKIGGRTATEQFYRTERWLGCLKAIYSGMYKPTGNFDEPLDYIFAFFLNCHHIKDWLKHVQGWCDKTEAETKCLAVEQFVCESEALMICADICNGYKHPEKKYFQSGNNPLLHSIHSRFDNTGEAPVKTVQYKFKTNGGETDAYALANKCVELWREFIRSSTGDSLCALAERNPKRGKR